MKDLYLNILAWLEKYGTQIGFAILIAPMLWDILFMGWCDLSNWKICKWGILIQLFGAGMMLGSKHAKRWGK